MPLMNRVDPFGRIHAVAARGLFTGNRGIIHDPATRTLLPRRWSGKAWIICDCSYKDVRREVMGYNGRSGGAGWTELFFLDEVTALAAGHRPCFTCRRTAARDYAAAVGRALGVPEPRAPFIDDRLHRERLASAASPRLAQRVDPATLPDGAMICDGTHAYALRDGGALRWSFDGYEAETATRVLDTSRVWSITPATTLAALRHGYRPVWHPEAAERTA